MAYYYDTLGERRYGFVHWNIVRTASYASIDVFRILQNRRLTVFNGKIKDYKNITKKLKK